MHQTGRTARGRILKVEFDRESAAPLYMQIYKSIRGDILSGLLMPSTRLPSTRYLAEDLGVARSTVVQAYEQLRAEGYIEGIHGAVTRVSASLPEQHLQHARTRAPVEPRLVRRAPKISMRNTQIAAALRDRPAVLARPPRAFRVGVPAIDVFPVDIWGRLLARRWSRTTSRQLAYGEPFGHLPLRTAIADYLRAARGVRCMPEQVMITAGSQQAIDACARVLLDVGDQAWLEDPGYHGARGALAAAGARVVAVPVDAEGLVVTEGRRRAPGARLAFVTPSRQLPLGVTLSTSRRQELLDWAAGADAWVLEDDYDSEFRYASKPQSALQGIDRHGCVIYIGTFSKVMFPALRLGYAVLPECLVDVFAAARHFTDYHSPYLEQAVMADFVIEGHFERHIRRMRSIYQERRHILLDALREQLSDEVVPDETDGGMTLIAWLRRRDDVDVARAAREAGIDVLPLTPFALEHRVRPGMLMGYSGVRDADLREGVVQLAAAIRGMRTPTWRALAGA
ncbi:MAG TPA: PLP-dependent aminotransferase family protein [Gemmatimonadaceae bacterium]|nr:PLP-dependent aminotransferase family protein [Gemmatimonadaceae bacterium]